MLIKKGMKGSPVIEIQKMLKTLGYYKGKIDGIFGNQTEDAVKQYQRNKQIAIDGIVGDVTYTLLRHDYDIKITPNTLPIIKPAPIKITGTPLPKANVKYIVLHHTASTRDLTWQEINEEHKARGFTGFGYHFYVIKNGTIYAGRPLNVMGVHAKGINDISVGVCWSGNFEVEEPTPAQIAAGKQLITWLRYKVFSKPNVIGHFEAVKINRNATVTACPGKKFPLLIFKQL
jgi:peptidoglycan hydrolase-like protein with peptidoglycan-binding domain